MQSQKNKNPFTHVIHAGQNPDTVFGSVSVPIFQSSTFSFKNVEEGASRFAGQDDARRRPKKGKKKSGHPG